MLECLRNLFFTKISFFSKLPRDELNMKNNNMLHQVMITLHESRRASRPSSSSLLGSSSTTYTHTFTWTFHCHHQLAAKKDSTKNSDPFLRYFYTTTAYTIVSDNFYLFKNQINDWLKTQYTSLTHLARPRSLPGSIPCGGKRDLSPTIFLGQYVDHIYIQIVVD